jgi:hypothetical protein
LKLGPRTHNLSETQTLVPFVSLTIARSASVRGTRSTSTGLSPCPAFEVWSAAMATERHGCA